MSRVQAIEDWLSSHAAKFVYSKALPLAEIDRERSLANQARVTAGPLDEETVFLYAEAIRAKDDFPPIVVYQRSKRYVVIDGNHRMEATRLADRKTLEAYVVEKPTLAQIKTLTYEANIRHGKPTSLKERALQAADLAVSGVSQTDAAVILGVPVSTVRQELQVTRAIERIGSLGVKPPKAANSARRLDNISSDVVLKEASQLVEEVDMPFDLVTEMVSAINRQKTETRQLGVVTQYKERAASELATTAGGRVPLPRRLKYVAIVSGGIRSMDVDEVRKQAEKLDAEFKAKLRSNVKDALGVLRRVLEALRDGAK